MILQALVRYYEALAARGEVSRPGWSSVKVSYVLYLDDDGRITQAASVMEEQERGKKKVPVPRLMTVPAPVKRTVGVEANFLCDNSGYILGVDSKGNAQRTAKCFEACKKLHNDLLGEVDSKAARAVVRFFGTWDPASAEQDPVLSEIYDDITGGANIVFRVDGVYAHEDIEIAKAWQRYLDSDEGKEQRVCMLTGNTAPIATLHPSIKGIAGAQSSGASLVSFNAPSSCSYDREQGLNAPTSEYAAFAYGTALNHLIADRQYTSRIGDTTVLCWAENADTEYQSIFSAMMFGGTEKYTEDDLREMTHKLCQGIVVEYDESMIDPDMDFYVLGIAPNAARLSVRFFYHNSFGTILRNIREHYERMEIVIPGYEQHQTLPLWKVMNETVNQNSRDKSPSPLLAGEMVRAILVGSPYPATLINAIELRIRAEHDIPWRKAAIIKAYYLKNTNPDVPKEVLTVSLNPESDNTAYNLGRLFSALEAVQEKANPGINATIKDKYFNSASATPAVVFPVLINLAQKHLKKLDGGMRVYCEKQLGEITEKIGEGFPAHLTLPQQGSFQLGYYHQTQARYQRKDKED